MFEFLTKIKNQSITKRVLLHAKKRKNVYTELPEPWELMATARYVINWLDDNKQPTKKEDLHFFFKRYCAPDGVTYRDYEVQAYGDALMCDKYQAWEKDGKMWKYSGILPDHAKTVIFQALGQ